MKAWWFGDSITFGNEMDGDGNQYTHRHSTQVSALQGYTEENNGWSGAKLVERNGGNSFETDVPGIPTYNAATDAVFYLAYGINDFLSAKGVAEPIEDIIDFMRTGLEDAIDRLTTTYDWPADKIVVVWYYLRGNHSEWVSLGADQEAVAYSKGCGFCDLNAWVEEQADAANYAVEDDIHYHEHTAPNNWATRMSTDFVSRITFEEGEEPPPDDEVSPERISFKSGYKLA